MGFFGVFWAFLAIFGRFWVFLGQKRSKMAKKRHFFNKNGLFLQKMAVLGRFFQKKGHFIQKNVKNRVF